MKVSESTQWVVVEKIETGEDEEEGACELVRGSRGRTSACWKGLNATKNLEIKLNFRKKKFEKKKDLEIQRGGRESRAVQSMHVVEFIIIF